MPSLIELLASALQAKPQGMFHGGRLSTNIEDRRGLGAFLPPDQFQPPDMTFFHPSYGDPLGMRGNLPYLTDTAEDIERMGRERDQARKLHVQRVLAEAAKSGL